MELLVQNIQRKIKLNVFIFSIFIIYISCGQESEKNISYLRNLKDTHIVKNDLVLRVLDSIYNKKDIYDTKDGTIIFYAKEEQKYNYSISSCITNFDLFKKNMPVYGELIGHLKYKDKVVLLFGDIDQNLFEKTSQIEKALMYFKKKSNIPPPIYDPVYLDFEIKNDSLHLKNIGW